MLETLLSGRLMVKSGDITTENVDAIVNAANSTLLGGGGVDGAIHRAGGAEILAACREIRRTRYPHGLPTGEAVITTGGSLPARYVIHTVGPIYGRNGAGDAELLANAYRNSLALAVENELRSIAFPAISTGVYGYPPLEAARLVSRSIEEFLATEETLSEIRLVFFSERGEQIFLNGHLFSR